jgi:hypothetical protein
MAESSRQGKYDITNGLINSGFGLYRTTADAREPVCHGVGTSVGRMAKMHVIAGTMS